MKQGKHKSSSWFSGSREAQSFWMRLYCSNFCSLPKTCISFRLKRPVIGMAWTGMYYNKSQDSGTHSVSLHNCTFTVPQHVACMVLSGICCFSFLSLFLHIHHFGGAGRGSANARSGVGLQLLLNSEPVQQLEFKSESKIFHFIYSLSQLLQNEKEQPQLLNTGCFTKMQFFPAKQIKENSPNPLEYIFPLLSSVVMLLLSFLSFPFYLVSH